jgi:hypothetical protein
MSTPFFFKAAPANNNYNYYASSTLKMCTTDTVIPAYWQSASFTRNIAKASTNVPGFRADNGFYYYSSIY